MKHKIIIELDSSDYRDTDVIKMGIREQTEKYIEEYNKLNQTDVKLNSVTMEIPAMFYPKPLVKTMKQQLEERAENLFPVNIIKKKDKSKPLKSAYVQGGLDTREIIENAQKNGISLEELYK